MERNIDGVMSRLCNRLMSCAQSALDAQNYALEEMEYILNENPDRDDVRACIEEIKAKNKASESENWATANHWAEHFDGIGGEPAEDTDDTEDTEEEESSK